MTRPRILCVDDSKALRMGMKNLLQAKFDVVGAGDGVEALKILTTESFDLIILDLDMPKLNGAQTIAQLREREDATPVILLTAEARTSHIKRVMDYGVLDYILKPCSPQDLVPKIEKALHKASQEPSLSMPSGPVSKLEALEAERAERSGPSTSPKAETKAAGSAVPKRVEPTISGPTVLLIDDMKSVGTALKRFVKDSIRIDQVLSEASTLQAIAKRQYQAVVVDVELPIADMAGWLGRLRLQQPLASYVALGLPTREDLPQWSKKTGFDDYIYKPFLEDEVRRFVMTHVDEKRKNDCSRKPHQASGLSRQRSRKRTPAVSRTHPKRTRARRINRKLLLGGDGIGESSAYRVNRSTYATGARPLLRLTHGAAGHWRRGSQEGHYRERWTG